MFKNKRKYQYDQITRWIKSGKLISKVKLSKKMGITRVTLDKLINNINYPSFIEFGRKYSNNRIKNVIRKKLFDNTIDFLEKINTHRKETTFIPTFITLKQYIDESNEVSLRTYQNIIKENNFYWPSCTRKTKRVINKRINKLKNR